MNFEHWNPGSLTIRGVIYFGRHSDGRERFKIHQDMVLMQGTLFQITVNESGKRIRHALRTTPGYPKGRRITHRIYGFGKNTGKEFVMLGELTCFTTPRVASSKSSGQSLASPRNGTSGYLGCECPQCSVTYAHLLCGAAWRLSL